MARGRITKRSSGNEVQIDVNMDPVIEVIAAGEAIADLVAARGANARYISAVVDVAYEEADKVFNTETAAYARSTGEFGHMYEWGTIGINTGRTNVRQPPEAPTARLWHNFTEGVGLDRAITYVFKPSVANVPKPTKAKTGMDTEVIAAMRDHVFTWKAKVMEFGQTVTIRPREAEFLLIPAYEHNREFMRPHDIKRGYMLTREAVETQPGIYREAFTEWWTKFWMGRGGDIVDASVQTQILSDAQIEMNPKTMGKTRPVQTFSVLDEIAISKKAVEKRLEARARLRANRGADGDE